MGILVDYLPLLSLLICLHLKEVVWSLCEKLNLSTEARLSNIFHLNNLNLTLFAVVALPKTHKLINDYGCKLKYIKNLIPLYKQDNDMTQFSSPPTHVGCDRNKISYLPHHTWWAQPHSGCVVVLCFVDIMPPASWHPEGIPLQHVSRCTQHTGMYCIC